MRSTKSRVLTLSVLLAFGFVQVFGSGIAPAAYQLVLQAGIALARRTQINFIGAGVTCVDNAGLTRTDCTIPGSSYLFSSTADATNAAVAEATVIGAGSGSLTLAANYFGTAGNPLIVSAAGHYSTPVAPGTLRIRLKIGAATVLDTGAFVPQPSLVQQVWTLEARVVSRAVGAGGTVMVQSQFHPGAGAPVGQDWPLLNTAAVALDTTAANAVALTAEWSAAGGETITGTNFLMYGVTGASVPTPVGYATIQQATVPLAQRQTVNFTGAGVTCVDNPGSTRTDCTVTSGGIATATGADTTKKAASAGNLFFPSDGIYIRRDTGAAWANWGPIFPCVEPVNTDFTDGPGVPTVNTTYGGMVISCPPSAGDALSGRGKAVPAEPWSVEVGYLMNYQRVNYLAAGLFISDGTKIVAYDTVASAASLSVSVDRYSDSTTFVGSPFSMPVLGGSMMFLKVYNDGTNIHLYYSANGRNWTNLFSEAKGAYLNATRIGVFVNSASAAYGAEAHIFHLRFY